MGPEQLQKEIEAAMAIECWVLPESLAGLTKVELHIAEGRRLTVELITRGELPAEYNRSYAGERGQNPPPDEHASVIAVQQRTRRISEEFPGESFTEVRSKYFYRNSRGVITRPDIYDERGTVHTAIKRMTAGHAPYSEEAPFLTATVNLEKQCIEVEDIKNS